LRRKRRFFLSEDWRVDLSAFGGRSIVKITNIFRRFGLYLVGLLGERGAWRLSTWGTEAAWPRWQEGGGPLGIGRNVFGHRRGILGRLDASGAEVGFPDG
jgi:hypothetical protein